MLTPENIQTLVGQNVPVRGKDFYVGKDDNGLLYFVLNEGSNEDGENNTYVRKPVATGEIGDATWTPEEIIAALDSGEYYIGDVAP